MNKAERKTFALTVVGTIVAFLIAATVLAQDAQSAEANSGEWEHRLNNSEELKGFSEFGFFKRGHGRTWRVRCDRGEKLSKALRRARANDTIKFRGTCYESVVIKTDSITLVGINGATIDGSKTPSEAVVLIDGARGFELTGFSVANGSDQGVLATHQAQGTLRALLMQYNGTVGLSVDRSHVEIVDLVLDNNTTGGMDAYTGSTVVAKGSLSASNNGGDGLAVNGKTFFELRGANVAANGNAGSGVSIINDSRLQVFSFPEAQGSSIYADNNGFAGIGILGSELGVVGSQFFGSGANIISASNNAIFGFFAPAGAILSPHATAQFNAQGNGVGMLLEDGASILIVGGLNLTQNGAGLSAHGAGTLNIVSVPPNPSNVDQNQIDFDLGFGTRVTTDGVGFTSVSCDDSVLTRGISCP
ncbi:MAG: hypothetical protein K0U72_12105 [Gammaproteobacteria bacterium]|nr:hypothetical protein [Gammaproteobacteria bacterium]